MLVLQFDSDSGHLCAIKEVRVVCDDQTSKECLKQLNQGEETLFVYLEYVSGGSIHKLLQEYGALIEPVIQNYTGRLSRDFPIFTGETQYIVLTSFYFHRDIKGADILVDPDGEIKLADFGMAKHIL
ncbi:Mitogen-activated protein kinase kinase kinase YODA [Spatholobus suberectus]|nr:Mitogen-activated protein kinase kinase kinase YODA [Spatholobus suberectus]